MSQVEGSYEAAAAYERDQRRMQFGEGGARTPPRTGAQLPPDPGAGFGRMREAFERETGKGGAKADGAKANPFGPDAPLLPGVVRLVRTAARCAEEHGTDYANRTKHEPSSLAPASFMHTLSMVLDTAADVLDELVHVDEESRGE